MTLIALAIGLLVVAKGTKLLIQTKQESPGRLFRLISWLILIMGFFVVIISINFTCRNMCMHHDWSTNNKAAHHCRVNEMEGQADDVAGCPTMHHQNMASTERFCCCKKEYACCGNESGHGQNMMCTSDTTKPCLKHGR